MKKAILVILAALMVVMAAGCSQSTQSGTSAEKKLGKVKLTFATHLTENHYLSVEASKFWMDKVVALTNGQVEFAYYPNQQLGKAVDTYELVKNKTADIGYLLYIDSKLPLSELPMVPNLYSNAYEGTMAYWEVVNQSPFLDKHLIPGGVRPIIALCVDPYTIATANKKVEKLEDLKQLKIRGAGGLHDVTLALIGATPVNIGIQEALEALQKKTIDGNFGSATAWKPYQLDTVLKYAIIPSPLNGWGGIFGINEEVYQSLPQNVKDAMAVASKETVMNLAKKLGEIEKGYIEEYKARGMEVYSLNDAEMKKWREKIQPEVEEWLKKKEDKGLPARAVYAQFQAAVKKYKK